jgi:pseudouridine-5'-phosphate glycosidase
MSQIDSFIQISQEVRRALQTGTPVVALESTVITHGLPYPENLALAEDMEDEVRTNGATPATICVMEGRILVGVSATQLRILASHSEGMMKISLRDFAPAISRAASGGTTVAATMHAAHAVGIKVFATGGIGGVHFDLSLRKQGSFDISSDLPALASIPMIVVCAGAKAILDLAATLEVLETWAVPVIGFQTSDFPAFYSQKSGFKTSAQANSAEQVIQIAKIHWELGMKSGVLVAVPPPEDVTLPAETVKQAVNAALKEAQALRLRGQEVTPFLLRRVNEKTSGESLRANLGLLLNNANIATQIARSF